MPRPWVALALMTSATVDSSLKLCMPASCQPRTIQETKPQTKETIAPRSQARKNFMGHGGDHPAKSNAGYSSERPLLTMSGPLSSTKQPNSEGVWELGSKYSEL